MSGEVGFLYLRGFALTNTRANRLQHMPTQNFIPNYIQSNTLPLWIGNIGQEPRGGGSKDLLGCGHKWLKMSGNRLFQDWPTMTDEQMLDGLRQGGSAQQDALHEIYMVKGRSFCRYFSSQGVSFSESEDILQEVVLKVLAKFDSVHDGHSFNAWMWQVARNCLNDHLRQYSVSKEVQLDDEQWAAVEANIDNCRESCESSIEILLQECMTKGLVKFAKAEPERAYVLELVVEGVDQHEIADRVGRTYGAIRTFIYECRKKLAPYVEHCLQFLPA
jgi:RNA polymerase sigma-70 factor (ECF subfamily)